MDSRRDPEVQLIAPSLALSSCVRACLGRDTTKAWPPLDEAQRRNHFPATPLCTVSWFVQGEADGLGTKTGLPGPRLPRVTFGGPQTRPTASYNPGPVQAFMLCLFPDALHALTGIDVAAHTDRLSDFDEVFDDEWKAMSAQVLAAPDDHARVACIESFLRPRWRAADESHGLSGRRLERWLGALAIRAAAVGRGRSVRQAERHIKTWAGLPLRRLRRMDRSEAVLFSARDSLLAGKVDWSGIAAQNGYADQAHLCREVREVSGSSPAELGRKVLRDESYWIYRLWG